MGYEKIDKHVAEGSADRILRERAKYDSGTKGPLPVFYRYVVLETVFDPTVAYVDLTKYNYWENALGVSNMEFALALPRNTIIGQRIIDGTSTSSEEPMFLFPFFPSHLAMPCKPGEHVWVMFEAPGIVDTNIGYWFCKITEVGHVDDVNHTHAPRAYESSFVPNLKDLFTDTADAVYEFANGQRDKADGERFTIAESIVIPGDDEGAYEKLLTETDSSQLMKYEKVPRYRKRPGDLAFEGSNNTLIVLGTDRTGAAADLSASPDPAKGVKPGKFDADMDGNAGMIDLVAGRGQTDDTGGKEVTSKKLDKSEFNKELGKSGTEISDKEGNPDWKTDRSRVMIVQRTMVDANLGLDSFNTDKFPDGKGKPGSAVKDPSAGSGAIVIKSDKVRIIARADVEILVSGYETDAKGNVKALDDPDKFAAIVIRSNGDIIFRPSKLGYIKLGGDDADKGLVCSDAPVTAENGGVSGSPLVTTMGGFFAGAKPEGGNNGPGLSPGLGKFANKILVKLHHVNTRNSRKLSDRRRDLEIRSER